MTDVVWRMSFVGGDWDGREQLVPDVGGRPQGRFLAPYLDGISLNLTGEAPVSRTPYSAYLVWKGPKPGCEGPKALGWLYATVDELRAWKSAGAVDPDALDLMATASELVP